MLTERPGLCLVMSRWTKPSSTCLCLTLFSPSDRLGKDDNVQTDAEGSGQRTTDASDAEASDHPQPAAPREVCWRDSSKGQRVALFSFVSLFCLSCSVLLDFALLVYVIYIGSLRSHSSRVSPFLISYLSCSVFSLHFALMMSVLYRLA